MAKTNFTVRTLERLAAKEKRYNLFDSETSGLGVAIYPSGQKTFFHLRKVQGWPRRTTLGVFPEMSIESARGKASELNGKLSKWKTNGYEGPNPVERPRKIATLGEVLDHYIEYHLKANAKNPEHAVQYARWQFDTYLTNWRNRPLSTITRDNVRERHAEIAQEHGAVTANRTITFLRTVINHAVDPDVNLWDGVNPARNPRKFLIAETTRNRTLQREEFKKFLDLLAKEDNPDLRDAVLLALFTGQRRGSILGMRWADLDFRKGLWTVTTAKGKKGQEPHILPLVDEAVAVLKRRSRIDNSPWVFPARNPDEPLCELKKPWLRFIRKTGISNLTFHDLRRTLATFEGEANASVEVIQRTLGHTEDSAATRIYDRSDRRQAVRSAMKKAAASMLSAGKISKRKLLAAPREAGAP